MILTARKRNITVFQTSKITTKQSWTYSGMSGITMGASTFRPLERCTSTRGRPSASLTRRALKDSRRPIASNRKTLQTFMPLSTSQTQRFLVMMRMLASEYMVKKGRIIRLIIPNLTPYLVHFSMWDFNKVEPIECSVAGRPTLRALTAHSFTNQEKSGRS